MHVNYAVPTHNPWHPTYELTAEGRERVMRETAPHIVAALARENPDAKSVSVSFGGVPYAGFVRA
jgi:hypothetical protein